MEKNNIANVYRFYNKDFDTAYLYSTLNINTSFSYFILTSKDGLTSIKKLHNAIRFLQLNNLVLRKVDKESPEFDEFVDLFLNALGNEKDKKTNDSQDRKLKFVYSQNKK